MWRTGLWPKIHEEQRYMQRDLRAGSIDPSNLETVVASGRAVWRSTMRLASRKQRARGKLSEKKDSSTIVDNSQYQQTMT